MITDIKFLESQFGEESASELGVGEMGKETLSEGFIGSKFNGYVKNQTAKRDLAKFTLDNSLGKASNDKHKSSKGYHDYSHKSTEKTYRYEPITSPEEEKAYEMFIKDACKAILPKLSSIIKSNPAEAGTYTISTVSEVIENESGEDGFIKWGYTNNAAISLGDFSIYNHKDVKSKKVNARSTELWDNNGEFYRAINRINDLTMEAIDKSGFGKGDIDGDWDGNDIYLIPNKDKVQEYINKYAPKSESAIKDITAEFNAFMESQFNNSSTRKNDEGESIDAVIAEIMNKEELSFTNTFDTESVNEAMIKSAKDIYHNKNKFKSGETNLCFITGLSGSGKSSMGTAMVKDAKNIEHYDMDDIVFNKQNHDMNYYKNYGDLVYKFFSGPGQKYFVTFKEIKSSLNTSEDKYRDEITNAFVDFAISYARSHKSTKFIVEGVWLYRYVSPNKLKDYAVCIKGTSAATSMMRAAKRDNDYIGKFKKGAVWVGDEMKLNKYRAFYKDSVSEEEESTDNAESIKENRTIFGSVDNTELMYMSCYEAYLYNTINNESRLTEALINECGLHESTIMLEADLKQEAKSKWETFINFINRMIDRFNVAMDKILYGKIQYLEDNKNVILNTPWRDDIPYEYEGDYDEAVDRVMNTKCPVFNYERDARSLRQEGYAEAIKVFMAGAGFKYTDDKDIKMEDQFKNYFLAKDHGKKNGKLSDLKPQKIYNFCYNRAKIDAIIKADSSALTQSTNIILNAINKERRERGEDVTKPSNMNSQASVTGNGGSTTDNNKSGNATPATGTTNPQQNISDSFLWININEAGGEQQSPTGTSPAQTSGGNQNTEGSNKESSSGKTGLTIGNSSPVANDKGTENTKTDKNDTTKQDIDNILTKWTTLCRCLITSKLTAVQQISHDYMAFITAHVNSVNGESNNKDQKQDDNQQQPKQDQNNNQTEEKK